jgi:hypothetical protein
VSAAACEFTARASTVVDEQKFRQIEKNVTKQPKSGTNRSFLPFFSPAAAARRRRLKSRPPRVAKKGGTSGANLFPPHLFTPTHASRVMLSIERVL